MKNWVEQYRPKSFEEYVFQDDTVKQQVDKFISTKSLNNLMLYGVRGTGKTTLANLLVKWLNVSPNDVLKVNCSDKKIEYIRDVIIPFANTMADGEFRIVRLEEFDFLSKDAQALLRSFMEEVHDNCKFIATCNYPNRILPELRSRMAEISFKTPNMEQLVDRILFILDAENIVYDPDAVMNIIDRHYPDIRSIINYLEANSINGKLEITEQTTEAPWKEAIRKAFIAKNLFAERKILSSLTTDDIPELFKELVTLSCQNDTFARAIIPIIAENEYRLTFVGDAELHLTSMFIFIDPVLKQ